MKVVVATATIAALAALQVDPAAADYSVSVKGKDAPLTDWEGWGTSLCWFANVFGDRADVADLLFTNASSVSVANSGVTGVPGLGLNIARYNIGGTGSNVVNDNGKAVSIKASSDMPAFKAIETFWLDWFNSDPASTSWNWNVDAKQRALLLAAKARGANQLEAFSNSPPWWMTVNHATAGADSKGTIDNLTSWNYEQFAMYLATVVKYAKDNWGIDFNYVQPFNEPMATWWVFPKNQEGCHFTLATQKSVLKYLRAQLNAKGLQSVAVAASDENNPQQAYDTLQTLAADAAVLSSFQKVNTHGYDGGVGPYRGTIRGPLKTLVQQKGKKLWDSEYGEADGSGLSLAESIALDINDMGVSAFVYWQALDSGGWGLVQSNPGDVWIGGANPKYYVMAQYSRHIRPGMKIISSGGDKKTVVAFDAARKVLVIVTVNTGAAQSITFDLSSYASVTGPVTVWKTETSGSGALYSSSTLLTSVAGKSFKSTFAAKSVQTFEIQGVSL